MFTPTDTTREVCPTHGLGLTQVRDRKTGKDTFLCPKFMECPYSHDPSESFKTTINPEEVTRDPDSGVAICYCGYATQRVTRKQGAHYQQPFWRCPASREPSV
jgi:ssDNA-binding Zn-finger/Zn-ribbon topoisomerase 1